MQWKRAILVLCSIFNIVQLSTGEQNTERFLKNSISVATFCRAMPDWTLIADPLECRKFHACIANKSQQFECGEHFYFNRIELRCMPGDCLITDVNTCQGYDVQPVPNDCYKFSFCEAGKRTTFKCPRGLYFDSEKKICRQLNNSPDFKCRCGVLPNHASFSNVKSCDTYYSCINDKAVLHSCPRGNFFNARINACLPDVNGECLQADDSTTFCKGKLGQGPLFQAFPNDCTKFQICVLGKVFTKQCQKGLYYDAEHNICSNDAEYKCLKKNGEKLQIISQQPLEEQEEHADS